MPSTCHIVFVIGSGIPCYKHQKEGEFVHVSNTDVINHADLKWRGELLFIMYVVFYMELPRGMCTHSHTNQPKIKKDMRKWSGNI